ncbi:hypothetical protein [Nakamurella deserti]|uniref:hypothetical protein n=1 Tax=Nakamurella deserti TaxID=2164074 RepID=UPI000DBE27D0|nr:hypothetical protein [Nakamurella deserti]
MAATTSAVTAASLGAWVLTCNPRLTDPARLRDEGVERWCVASNYRSDLFAPGQPVLLWLTGTDRRWPRGLRGRGVVAGPATPPGPDGRYVPLRLDVWDTSVDVVTLAAAGLGDLEVLRQPRIANPSFVTVGQWARLEPLLPR